MLNSLFSTVLAVVKEGFPYFPNGGGDIFTLTYYSFF